MKKTYYIEFLTTGGSALSSCDDIGSFYGKLEEILEREDVIINSIKVYTEEKPGYVAPPLLKPKI